MANELISNDLHPTITIRLFLVPILNYIKFDRNHFPPYHI